MVPQSVGKMLLLILLPALLHPSLAVVSPNCEHAIAVQLLFLNRIFNTVLRVVDMLATSCKERNVDQASATLVLHVNTTSETICRNACRKRADCALAVFNSTHSTCALKATEDPQSADPADGIFTIYKDCRKLSTHALSHKGNLIAF